MRTVFPKTAHIFCRVIDNFGDIGVCWRLARQFADQHAVRVTLWVDDLNSFRRLCPMVDGGRKMQLVSGVEIRKWDAHTALPEPDEMPDLVIEAFGCELPAQYVAAMAQRRPQPAWINLEYLSAESWVEGCHEVQSLHPSLPLVKYFFFPGFSGGTGGLLREQGLLENRAAFQRDAGRAAAFLTQLGVRTVPDVCRISLFCYPSAPVAALFQALQADPQPVICLVPHGVAPQAVERFLQKAPEVGVAASRGSLTVQVIPFLEQPEYDKLLWSCDLNFVRGEDSLVRAQWAARPFIWQIYPQQDAAHHTKLQALLDRYTERMPPEVRQTVNEAWHTWNEVGSHPLPWLRLRSQLPQIGSHMEDWIRQLAQNGDLASNLLRFIQKIG